MKVFLILILAAGILTDPLKIGKVNRAKTEVREAYSKGQFKVVISKCHYLLDTLQVSEDEIVLNLANAYYLTKDTAQAYLHYESLSASVNGPVRSKARQQLGVMSYKKGRMEEALLHFKQAIKADANNIDARYNYEMLKRKLDEKKKQDEKNQMPKEPSPFAKQLKAKAEALAAQGKFSDAYDLMSAGAKKDITVLYYNEFISRLKEVSEINNMKK